MPKEKIQCLLFDFDGTLADTLEASLRIYNRLSPVYGYRAIVQEDLPGLRQMTLAEFLRFTEVPRLRIPRILNEGKRIMSNFIGSIRPVEGVREVLPILRSQFPVMGVVTSNDKSNVEAFLKANGMEYFDFISSVPKLSGKAKHIRAAMRLFSCNERQVIYIGDETRDIKAARRAGVVCAAVSWGFNAPQALRERDPDILIEHPADLLKIHELLGMSQPAELLQQGA